MAEYHHLVILLLFATVFSLGCLQTDDPAFADNTTDEPQVSENPAKQTADNSSVDQQPHDTCPPSIEGCTVTRGAEGALDIRCPDGRRYTREASGGVVIRYPGMTIAVTSTGNETIEGFDYADAHCLIDWLRARSSTTDPPVGLTPSAPRD